MDSKTSQDIVTIFDKKLTIAHKQFEIMRLKDIKIIRWYGKAAFSDIVTEFVHKSGPFYVTR